MRSNKQESLTKESKNKRLLIVAIILLIAAFYGFDYYRSQNSQPGELDAFAQCLRDKGVRFYGATWCPHCQNQKALFGKSFKLLDSVECALPSGQGINAICKKENIESLPTWIFADGSREVGEQTLEDLAEKTGCQVDGIQVGN